MKKSFFIFLATSLGVILLFYFSDSSIFEVELYQNGIETTKEVSLKSLFTSKTKTSLTYKGWAILLITSIGLPLIVAWRSTLTKYSRKTGEPKKSIWDKL
ncbi:MAG: hypothetical protein ACWA41_03390 [Putridiphycobacter sp.]